MEITHFDANGMVLNPDVFVAAALGQVVFKLGQNGAGIVFDCVVCFDDNIYIAAVGILLRTYESMFCVGTREVSVPVYFFVVLASLQMVSKTVLKPARFGNCGLAGVDVF